MNNTKSDSTPLRAHDLPRPRRLLKLVSTPGQTFEVVAHGRQTLAIAKARPGDQVWLVSEARETPLYKADMVGMRTTRLLLKLSDQGALS